MSLPAILKSAALLTLTWMTASLSAHAGSAEDAQDLIHHLSRPEISGLIYRDFTLETQLVPCAEDLEKTVTEALERDFWKNTLYGENSGQQTSYDTVRRYAEEESGISAFRVANKMASEFFLTRYVPAGKLRNQLAKLLPSSSGLGTGYVDELSDPFGDQFFVFPFRKNDSETVLLAVTIHHAYN